MFQGSGRVICAPNILLGKWMVDLFTFNFDVRLAYGTCRLFLFKSGSLSRIWYSYGDPPDCITFVLFGIQRHLQSCHFLVKIFRITFQSGEAGEEQVVVLSSEGGLGNPTVGNPNICFKAMPFRSPESTYLNSRIRQRLLFKSHQFLLTQKTPFHEWLWL